MRHLTRPLVVALFLVSGLLLVPKDGRAECTCVNLNFILYEHGAYDGPPLSFSAGCSAARADADYKFNAEAAGTCNSLGMWGGLCQVTPTITHSCFDVGPTDYFIDLRYDFHCLSCGIG
jgi:hypothetical protein